MRQLSKMRQPFSDNPDSGQITVFLSLVFLLLMSTCFVMIEGVREYMIGALCDDALQVAAENVLANYDRPLFEQYHLFFLDPREKRQIRQDGIDSLEKYFHESSFFGFYCQSLSVKGIDAAPDREGKILKHEIREWMKYRNSWDEDWMDRVQKMYDSYGQAEKASDNFASELVNARDDEPASLSSDELSAEPSAQAIQWKSIKESMDIYQDSDILLACLPSGRALSYLQADLSDLPSAGNKGLGSGPGKDQIMSGAFNHIYTIANLFPKEQMAKEDRNMFGKESYIMAYLEEHFHSFDREVSGKPDSYSGHLAGTSVKTAGIRLMSEKKAGGTKEESGRESKALKYEMEYMINGKASDIENLRRTFARIFHLRFLVNYSYARTEGDLWSEAGWIALEAAGQDGLSGNPEAGRLYLIGAAAYGQTLIDMRRLLAGKKVAIIPSHGSWQVNYDNLAMILRNRSVPDGPSGDISYGDYLKYFLMSEGMSRIRCGRMMDVMQMNVRLSEKDFTMKNSLFSFRWEADLRSRKWFPAIPGLNLLTGTEMRLNMTKVNTY